MEMHATLITIINYIVQYYNVMNVNELELFHYWRTKVSEVCTYNKNLGGADSYSCRYNSLKNSVVLDSTNGSLNSTSASRLVSVTSHADN